MGIRKCNEQLALWLAFRICFWGLLYGLPCGYNYTGTRRLQQVLKYIQTAQGFENWGSEVTYGSTDILFIALSRTTLLCQLLVGSAP